MKVIVTVSVFVCIYYPYKQIQQQSWLTSGSMLVVMDWQLRNTWCGQWIILYQWTFWTSYFK